MTRSLSGDRPDGYDRDRHRLIQEIEAEVAATADLTGRRQLDRRVVEAIASVPRHEFVPDGERALAYANNALRIGHGQTISQPFVVALMTDLLEVGPDSRVLEIGTGSGYQAAVLSRLVAEVWSVEVVPELAAGATEILSRLGCANVTVRQGDGAQGWPEHAPYDGIVVTACSERLPPALIEQLAPKGRMVVPVGGSSRSQMLTVVAKDADSALEEKAVLPVAFVPLV